MSSEDKCYFCGQGDNLMRCARCRMALYCSKEHQQQHWKAHKKVCKRADSEQPAEKTGQDLIAYANKQKNVSPEVQSKGNDGGVGALEDSLHHNLNIADTSTDKVMQCGKQVLSAKPEDMAPSRKSSLADFHEFSLLSYKISHDEFEDKRIQMMIGDMNSYGVCVINEFLGRDKGSLVLEEVKKMHKKGVFKDGQLVSNRGNHRDRKIIRSDKITWISGTEKGHCCDNISDLIQKVDSFIIKANKTPNNGILGRYTINSRTGAMVACYPGSGSHYVRHIDNPNRDGRCITAIYYLNVDWDISKDGGLLQIFPRDFPEEVANVEPVFDRMLFFWSDHRNPHEVHPAYNTRYAITLWYFDAVEREEACRRFEKERGITKASK